MAAPRNEALENYFDLMRTLAESDGYLALLRDFGEQRTSINSVESTASDKDLWFRKGQLNVINTLLNLRDNVAIQAGEYQKTLNAEEEVADIYA